MSGQRAEASLLTSVVLIVDLCGSMAAIEIGSPPQELPSAIVLMKESMLVLAIASPLTDGTVHHLLYLKNHCGANVFIPDCLDWLIEV